ncbi:MAG: C40 family peptidase [Roseibium sp.]|nr:C40 family peptidase [Roseibium sp.]
MTDRPLSGKARVVVIARSWIGTPYHPQASLKGVGCDCLGLLRGVWREFYGKEPEAPPPYSPDWGQVGGTETLLDAADRHLRRIETGDVAPGDVLVFRMTKNAIAKHCGIVSGPGRFIHALEGAGVCEVGLTGWWQKRAVAEFGFG